VADDVGEDEVLDGAEVAGLEGRDEPPEQLLAGLSTQARTGLKPGQ